MSFYTKDGSIRKLVMANQAWAILKTPSMELSFPCHENGCMIEAIHNETHKMRERARDILARADRIDAAVKAIAGEES